jgi:8-oxo-dGTP diphosphatase
VGGRKLIGIAIVVCRGHVLVGRRDDRQTLAGCAEFPGGKCRAGESSSDGAIRECREETGVAVSPVRCMQIVKWSYPHGDVELHFWQCSPAAEADVLPDASPPFRWIAVGELNVDDFPAANASVIHKLLASPSD